MNFRKLLSVLQRPFWTDSNRVLRAGRVRLHPLTLFAWCCFLALCPLRALGQVQEADSGKGESQFGPRVVVSLSGGGARGIATIGLFQAFEERHVKVTGIAGVSMGAIIGGLAACGYTSHQLESIVVAINFSDLLLSLAERNAVLVSRRDDQERHLITVRFDGITPLQPTGLLSAPRLSTELSLLTLVPSFRAGNDFSKLPIPFRAVATDIVSGQAVLCENGSMAEAMRASMAFPLAFTGVPRGPALLMDGGMRAPIPVHEALRMRSDTSIPVVAVDMTSPLVPRAQLSGLFEVASQVTTVMTQDLLRAELAAADYVVRPDLSALHAVDFTQVSRLIEAGYRAGQAIADSLWGRWKAKYPSIAQSPVADNAKPHIEQLLKEGLSNLPILGYAILSCRGNQFLTEKELIDSTVVSYERLTSAFVDSVGEVMTTRYHDHGMQIARIDSVVRVHDTVVFVINEGIIRQVDVLGAVRSRDWLIRSNAELQAGQPFRLADAHRGLDQLLGTGLFEQARLELLQAPIRDYPQGGVIARIVVQEEPPTQLRVGLHWNDEYQGEVLGELLDDNLMGIGLQGMIHSVYGNRRVEAAIQGKLERIFKTYLTGRVELFYKRKERRNFNLELEPLDDHTITRTGFDGQLGEQFRGFGLVSGGLRFQEVTDQSPDGSESRFGLRTLYLSSRVDTYDRRYFPTRGTRQSLNLEFTGKLFGGKVEYTRFQAEIEHAHSFDTDWTLLVRGALGLSRAGLPFSEQFTLGGPAELPGYRIDQVIGEKLIGLYGALRYRLPLSLYASITGGAGNTFARTEQIKLSGLRAGIGLQLSLDLPVGPIDLGYGWGKQSRRWFFAAGFTF